MKRALITLPLILVTLVSLCMSGERTGNDQKAGKLKKTAIEGDYVIFNVNNIQTYIQNDGGFNRNPGTGDAGFEWPKGTGNTAIYASGLWMGAKVAGEKRVAIAEYSSEFAPGPIAAGVNPADPQWKIYTIRSGDDASNSSDYANWPFADGAPALRNWNKTGDSLDSYGNKIPRLIGDMTSWCVYNDNIVHNNIGTSPLGVEVQMTVWGFNRSDALGNALFIRWKLINKGGLQLDSMYVSIWSDCDIGGGTADYDGCDTLLGLGYTFSGASSNSQYGTRPPAAGFDFLQGPIIPSPGDTVRLPDGTVKPGYKKLQMTSYLRYDNDNTIELGNPFTGDEVYNYFQTLTRSGLDVKGPDSMKAMFMYPGNPSLSNGPTNWMEDGGASDRRFMMSSGPFTMLAGDTQDVVGGCFAAAGSNNLGSVTALKNSDAMVQRAYDLDFDFPSPPVPPAVEVSPVDKAVVLTWGKDDKTIESDETYHKFEPVSGTYFDFEGYVVYQYDANSTTTANKKIIATYDVVNGVTVIRDSIYESNTGYSSFGPVIFGSDNGIKRSIKITKDAFTNEALKNDKDYYYAVICYVYDNGLSSSSVMKSAEVMHIVRPRLTVMGNSFSSSGLDSLGTYNLLAARTTVPQTSGTGAGYMIATIVQPDSITGDAYQIGFDTTGGFHYNVINTTKNDTIIKNKTHMADDEAFPIKDGIMWKVVNEVPQALNINVGNNGVVVTPTDPAQQWFTGWDAYGADYGFVGLNGGVAIAASLVGGFGGWDNTMPFESCKKVEVRFDSNHPSQSYCYRRAAGGGPYGSRFFFQSMVQIPVSAWDVTDPANPIQLNLAWRDNPVNGIWDPWTDYYTEFLVVCASPYDSTGTYYNTPLVDGGPFETDAMYVLELAAIDGHTPYESANTATIVPCKPLTVADVFNIDTKNFKATPGDVATAKTQIDRINAVPNPYFGANAYEHNQFNKVVRITNLPTKATVRVFNLVGELVNVLEKNDPNTTSIDWDLTNRNRLPVASGMYIIHIDMGAIGTKIIKEAVIMAEERLDNF